MSQVLVVDDSLSVRKALEKILKPHVTVVSAVSGEDARSQLDGLAPDLVIADVLMPGISGFDLCRELKHSAQHAAVPVLLISGIVDEAVRAQAGEVGASGVIKKPFTPDELLPLVNAALASAPVRETPPAHEPDPSPAPQPTADLRPLLQELVGRAGVRGVVVFDRSARLVASQGQAQALEALGQYLRFYTATAAVLGGRTDSGALQTVQLDYDHQTLLAVPLDAAHVLACLLDDASAVGRVKFLLRNQTQLQA